MDFPLSKSILQIKFLVLNETLKFVFGFANVVMPVLKGTATVLSCHAELLTRLRSTFLG